MLSEAGAHALPFRPVMLSEVGAHATMQSKHPV
jgi:hypothetical protein